MFVQQKTARRVVGMKQTIKALNTDTAETVFIASDAHDYIKDKLLDAAKGKETNIVYVETMKQLGNDCGISRPAAAAAVIKE